MKSTLLYYRSVFLRRIHYFLLITVLITVASLTLARILPAVYQSQTRLLVEASQIPVELRAPTVQSGAVEELQIIEERLMTRVNLLSIARELQVFPDVDQMTADQIVAGMRANTNIRYSAGRGEATLFDLTYSARTGETAANVVNRYVTIVLQNDAARRTERAGETLKFFEEEVQRLGEELAVQNAKLLKFNNENSDALPDTLDYRLNQQSLLQERLNSVGAQITALNEEKRRLIDVFNATGQVGAGAATNLTPEQQKLTQLQDSLRNALAIYSPENPKVKLIEAQIAQQEAVVAGQLVTSTDTGNGTTSILDINLAGIDARIDLLGQQSDQIKEQLAVLADTIERTPANTIRLGELQRSQASIQRQYDGAVDRLAKAAAGERIELLSKGQRIAVLDPPTVPSKPSSPNRFLIAVGGTMFGIVLGLGLVVLLELLNNSIRRPTDITRSLGITPIATVPYIRTPMEMVARRATIALIFAAVVFGVPALLFAVHNYYMPLDLIYDKLAGKLGAMIGIG